MLEPTSCRDAGGGTTWTPTLRLVLLRSGERTILVEERPGYASLVLEHGRRERSDWVYQIVVESEADEVMREYRVDGRLAAATLRLYSEYDVHREDIGWIEATGERLVMTCSLTATGNGSA